MICVGLDIENWAMAVPYLNKALNLSRGEYTLEDIYQAVSNRDMQLWVVHDGDIKAIFTTDIIVFPRLKRLRLIHCGGEEVESWIDVASDALDRFKEANGCKEIELVGRRGWTKRLSRLGYKEYMTITIKE